MIDFLLTACVNNFTLVVTGCLLIAMLFGLVLGIFVGVYITGVRSK